MPKMTYYGWARTTKQEIRDNKKCIIILDEIQKNDLIHHNALKKLVKEKRIVTRKFDQLIKLLIENNSITVARKKNRKYYSIKFDLETYEKELLHDIKRDLAFTQMDVLMIQQNFSKQNILNKSSHSLFLIKNIFRINEKISFFESLYGIESVQKFELKIKKHLKEVVHIIKNDKDAKSIFALIQHNQFPKSYTFSMDLIST